SGTGTGYAGSGDTRLGARVTEFRQREPGDGTPVSQETTAYVSYDDENLYVVFVCRDDPAKVRASIARREEIGGDDAVAVYLDAFHDRQHAYMFMTNPRGVQFDSIVTEGQADDYSFDAVWQSDGRVAADGYVVRLAIPFRSLRFPRAPTQTWGVALGRIILRNNEKSYWPHLTKRVKGFVPQFAVLQGVERLTGKAGRWALGAIAINDRAPGRVPAPAPLAGSRAGVGALRVQRELGEESTVGFLVTDRELESSSNRVFSLDSRVKLNKNWAFVGQVIRSENRKLGATTRLARFGALAQLEREGRHFDYTGSYLQFDPGFAAPLGFVRRVGYRQTEHKW